MLACKTVEQHPPLKAATITSTVAACAPAKSAGADLTQVPFGRPEAWQDEWRSVRNILCVRLDSMGDLLMTTPALRALKASGPDRRITLLTSLAGAKAAALIPEVDQVIVYEAPWMKASGRRTDSRLEFLMTARLRLAGFDAAVIFTVFSQNPLAAALLAYLAEIPRRLAHCRENPYQLLSHWVPEQDNLAAGAIRHEVRRQLDLVAAIGCQAEDDSLSVRVPRLAARKVHNLLSEAGLKLDCPWVVIHPGARAPSRRYSPQGFAQAAGELVQGYGVQVVFTGSAAERELVEEIRTAMGAPSVSFAGRLDLGEFAALLEYAPLLISNNTGPVHLAAGVGTAVVDIYALTNPQHTPWGVPNRVLSHAVPCKNCFKSICPMGHHDCLRLVSPQVVVQAALELLHETRMARLAKKPQAVERPAL